MIVSSANDSETSAPDDWEKHWTDYSDTATLNPAQGFRRRLIAGALGSLGAEARLVDVGSGQGDMLSHAAGQWPEAGLLGLELSAAGITLAQSKVPHARFVQIDLVQQQRPSEIDVRWATHAICSEVLEHVDDPVSLLRHAGAYLRPGGRLVVTVPGGPRSAFDRHIGHRRHYSRSRLSSELTSAGFNVDRVDAAGFPVFNLYKLAVIARGRALIEDAQRSDGAPTRGLAGLVTRVFSASFRVAPTRGRFGWQLIAIATKRDDSQ